MRDRAIKGCEVRDDMYHKVRMYIKSTTLYVPSSLLGEGHTRWRVRGWESPNFDDWRKSFALCLLCGMYSSEGFMIGS
jgi:hypothetical protein